MSYSQTLVRRVRQLFSGRRGITEKKMFGGVGFLLYGNICVGIWEHSLIARLGVELAEDSLKLAHVREFDITGKAMKGWVMIEPEGIETDEQLSAWIELAVEFTRTLPKK